LDGGHWERLDELWVSYLEVAPVVLSKAIAVLFARWVSSELVRVAAVKHGYHEEGRELLPVALEAGHHVDLLSCHHNSRCIGNGEGELFDWEPVVRHSVERLTRIRLVCTAREAAQRQDKSLVDQGKR